MTLETRRQECLRQYLLFMDRDSSPTQCYCMFDSSMEKSREIRVARGGVIVFCSCNTSYITDFDFIDYINKPLVYISSSFTEYIPKP